MGEDWRSGIWVCVNRHQMESDGKPEEPCPRHGAGWEEELILAARRPREDHWGVVECGRCGHKFVERNSEGVVGWLCNGCGGSISTRTQNIELAAEPNEIPESNQSELPIATDGGRTDNAGESE